MRLSPSWTHYCGGWYNWYQCAQEAPTHQLVSTVYITLSCTCEKRCGFLPFLLGHAGLQPQERTDEELLTEVLQINGYPDHIIMSATKQRERQHEEKLEFTITYVYHVRVAGDLRRVCRRFDIRAVFTTVSTLRKQLTHVKDVDPPLQRSGVVYNIPCSYGLNCVHQ